MTTPLQTAVAHLQAGRVSQAEAECTRILAAQPNDAHAIHLLGLVYRQRGRLDEAESLLLRSVGLQPGNAEFRANLAQFLATRERTGVAIEEFQRALALAPDFRPALLGLARLAMRTGRFALAEEQARRLVARQPQDAQGWSALGAALHGMGRHSEARAAFERSVAIAPDNGTTRYQLASTLCEEDLAEQALAQADVAANLGVAHRALAITRARALMQLDRYQEAEAVLGQLVATSPDDLISQFLLAQLRHTRGDADFARSLGQAAESSAATPAVRAAYADILRRSGQHEAAEAILRRLIADQGPVPQLLTALGTLLHEVGRYSEAVDLTRAGFSRQQDDATAAENHVAALLSAGAGKDARAIIESFGRRNPLDQRWITYRADAARQSGEDLYREWCDPQTMVRVYDIEPPPGYASIEDFHGALAAQLQTRHRQRSHPLDQSLRHGTQTSRGLLAESDPVIRQFLEAMAAPIAEYQSAMSRDASHPLFSRNTAPAKMVGCWSIRLQRGGYHVNHIHPQGWISSAYYVSVPAEVQDETLRSGWIKFGEPRFPMPGAAADRFVQPRPGRLVLFPSYLWHGTTPIQGDEPRLTAAFDAVPG